MTGMDINHGQVSCSINFLNDEELMSIFECLAIESRLRLRPVCRRWKSMVERSLKAVKVLDIHSLGVRISYQCLTLVLRLCINVQVIDLNNVHVFWAQHLQEDAEEDNHHRQALQLIMEQMITTSLRLHTLSLVQTDLDEYVDKYCLQCPEYFRRLKTLVTRDISDQTLNCLLDSEHIHTIDVENCCRLRRPELNRLGPNVKNLLLRQTRVWEPDIIQSLCSGSGKDIRKLSIDVHNERVWRMICLQLTELRELRVTLVTKRCDTSLVSSLVHLKSFWIEEGLPLDNDVLIQLIRSLKNLSLTELCLHVFSLRDINPILVEVRHNCPLIEKLDIKGKHFVTDNGWAALMGLRRLKHLDLSRCRLNVNTSFGEESPIRHLILTESQFSFSVLKHFFRMAVTLTEDQFVLNVRQTCAANKVEAFANRLPNNLVVLYDTICT